MENEEGVEGWSGVGFFVGLGWWAFKEGEGANVRCVRTSGWARWTEGAVGVDRFFWGGGGEGNRRRRMDLDLVGGEDERKKLGRMGFGGGPRTSGVERGDVCVGEHVGGQRRRRDGGVDLKVDLF